MFWKWSELRGLPVQATDGQIGAVRDLYFDCHTWDVRRVVVDTGYDPGGFPGKLVVLPPDAVLAVYLNGLVGNGVIVNRKKRQIEDRPEIDDHRSVLPEGQLDVGELSEAPVAVQPIVATRPSWDAAVAELVEAARLVSAVAASGYAIRVRDGAFGRARDVVMNSQTWTISYLVVAQTQRWLARQVLVDVSRVEYVDALHSTIRLDLTREGIQTASPFRPDVPLQW